MAWQPVYGAMSYGLTYYNQNRGYVGSGTPMDPLYQFINEVETTLDGSTGVTSIIFTPGTAPTGSEGMVYYDSASNGLLLYNGTTWITIDTAGASSLDTAYNTGRPITVDAGTITLTATDAANNAALTIVQSDTAATPGLVLTNAGTGPTIQIDGAGTGDDITGTSDLWTVSEAGVGTFAGIIVGATDLVFVEAGEAIRNDTNLEFEFYSPTATTEDISIGLGTNTNIITFSSDSGATKIDFDTIDDINGVGNIYFDSSASGITLVANEAADDLTIQVTGALNASLDLRSAGTGADAIKVYASAGGIDVDGTGTTMVMTNTANGSDDDFTIEVAGAQDSSLILQSAGTGGDALSLITSAATGDISIVSGDGIAVTSQDLVSIAITGAATEDFSVVNTGGSIVLSGSEDATDAVNIDATGGGIDIDAAGEAGQDIVITNTGGSVNLIASEAVTDAINIDASDAAGGVDIDSGTGGIFADSTGIISIDAADDLNLTLTSGADAEDLTIAVGGSGNSSLFLSSIGTATDAMSLQVTGASGGIDIDTTNDGIISIVSTDDLILEVTAGSTGEDIIIQTTGATDNHILIDSEGTTANTIALQSLAGGLDIDAKDDIVITVASTASGDLLALTQTGAVSGAGITATAAGTGAAAISLQAAAGGIDIDAGTSGINMAATAGDVTITNTTAKDIIIDAQAGRVLITGTESAADAILLTADGTNGEIALTAKVGGIDIDAASGPITIDAAGAAGDLISIKNTNGTGVSVTTAEVAAIQLYTPAGGIGLASGLAAADAIRIEAQGTNGQITVQNILGTTASSTTQTDASIQLYSQVGGIGLTSGLSAADAIRLETTAAGGLLTIQSAAGTDASAIGLIATAGGITAKVADGKSLKLGNADADAYFEVAGHATPATEYVNIVNTAGTAATAITMTALAGGINMTVNDASTLKLGSEGGDTYIQVAPHGTPATEIISVVNAAGTADTAITLTATAGGMTAKIADEKNLILGNAASDTYFKVTPSATPASEIISMVNAAGTANGAVVLTSTAGGVDINAKEMVKVDVAAGTAATAVITLTNTPGTDEAAISLQSVAGGVDIDAAAAKNVAIQGGQVLITSLDNAASAISLVTNVGITETIVFTNSAGTGTDAFNIDATLGGIDIDASKAISLDTSAAGSDIDLDSALGSVYLEGGEADAKAIWFNANNAAGGIDIDFGTGNLDIDGTGASADFTVDGDLFSIDGTGTSNITVTATEAAEDFTVSQAGIAIDASLVLSSSGNSDTDALIINATAGGMDIDAADGITISAAGAATEDITITDTGGSINLVATESAADAIVLNPSGTLGAVSISDHNMVNVGDIKADDIVDDTSGDIMYMVKTVVKTVDAVAAGTTDDFSCTSVGNVTEQTISLGAIIPAYAEVISAQIRCFETLVSSGADPDELTSLDLGTAAGGAQLLGTVVIDSVDEINATAAASGPLVAATNAPRTVYFNIVPGDNFDTLSAGRWGVFITYIDYSAAHEQNNPN
jgi:hypothetical protein